MSVNKKLARKVTDKTHHGKRNNNRYNTGKDSGRRASYDGDSAKLEAEGRNNNPNWYFTNEELARQGSYLSFQQIAGLPFKSSHYTFDYAYPVIKVRYLNPCPGVQTHDLYSSPTMGQKSAINLAGFKLFSKLSAYTGRKAEYGPQDISTMILFMGEIITLVEYIRRVFGVGFTYSMRNRIYPKGIIEAMGVDSNNLFANFSDYRMRFNAAITRLNQVPIPKSIAYFDKCASLYEKIYTDSDSPMATCIFDVPCTTWSLNEAGSQQGTVLMTHDWTFDKSGTNLGAQALSVYLVGLEYRIDELMNSSTFQVVYTDLLNLATKVNTEFWKFDYLTEGYMVMPEYNLNYLLQMHNSSVLDFPKKSQFDASFGVTPFNDVYPDANGNALFYNPAFPSTTSLREAIVDSITPDPGTEDRIEISRFIGMNSNVEYQFGDDTKGYVDMVLPDHYVVRERYITAGNITVWKNSNVKDIINYDLVNVSAKVDWDGIVYRYELNNGVVRPTGTTLGDFNYFTLIDYAYLRRLNDAIGMALYDLRS